jgi:hypothetical protein
MNTATAVISALTTLIVAMTGLSAAFGVLWGEMKKNTRATEEVHQIVNSRHDNLLAYQQILIQALSNAGITVPSDPSIKVESNES